MNDIRRLGLKFKGWSISYDCKPIGCRSFDWDYVHDNYDGDNDLCGSADSLESCIQEIIDIELNELENRLIYDLTLAK